MDISDERLARFAADVMSHPVGSKTYVCADWVEGKAPDHSQVGTKTVLTKELVLHHTRSNFSEEGETDLWAAACRDGNRWMIRVREMDARPDRPTELIARIVEALSEKYHEDLRYTFTPHHFNGYDIYVAHVEPQRI